MAIARALVNEPRLLLADEPTGNLDDDASLMVIDLLEKVRADHSCTLVMVTHNRELARRADQLTPAARTISRSTPISSVAHRRATGRYFTLRATQRASKFATVPPEVRCPHWLSEGYPIIAASWAR